jgi:hypothetical protein
MRRDCLSSSPCDAQFRRDLRQRPTAARQQGFCLPPELSPPRRALPRRPHETAVSTAQAIVSSGPGGSPPLRRISRSKAVKSARARRSAKKFARPHGRQFLGHGRRDKLIDARAVLLCTALDLRLDRAGQPKRVGALVFHVPILRIASAGVSTSIPNQEGTTPKSRRLNVTIATVDRRLEHEPIGWIA